MNTGVHGPPKRVFFPIHSRSGSSSQSSLISFPFPDLNTGRGLAVSRSFGEPFLDFFRALEVPLRAVGLLPPLRLDREVRCACDNRSFSDLLAARFFPLILAVSIEFGDSEPSADLVFYPAADISEKEPPPKTEVSVPCLCSIVLDGCLACAY